MDSLRDFSTTFEQSKPSQDSYDLDESLYNDQLSFIYDEIAYDKISLINLSFKYYMIVNRKRKAEIDTLRNKRNNKFLLNYNEETYKFVNNKIETAFENAMLACYTDFSEITQPLLSRDTINDLVALYKQYLPQHYECSMIMLGYNRKITLNKYHHLQQTGFYDRIVFYQYLTQGRVRYNHLFTFWGMVSTASAYARGQIQLEHNTFFGNSTSLNTLMRNTKSWRENMNSAIHSRLENEESIVACLDNNQKGYCVKYQRFGKSNNFVKVTGCVMKKYNYSSLEDNEVCDKVELTYCTQSIPSPSGMPHFENTVMTGSKIFDIMLDLFQDDESKLRTDICLSFIEENPDFSGERVDAYEKLISIFYSINLLRMATAGCYSRGKDEIRFVDNLPEDCQTETVKDLIKETNSLKSTFIFKNSKIFQHRVVSKWNRYYNKISEFIVPQVYLHDEITTDGYAKCIIELMSLHGILVKGSSDDDNHKWILGPKWNEKTIILCLDGLSLDRHRGFYNKLIKIPLSFTNAYKQSLTFQKALTRVIEVSGPLHTSFHMLQVIYIVYKCILKTSQHCIGWKKLKFGKVSECYKPCIYLLDILFEEVYRLLLFRYLSTNHDDFVTALSDKSIEHSAEILSIEVTMGFEKFIEEGIKTTTDQRWKLMLCFYKLALRFKLYEQSMKSGDAVAMEAIERDFCGIFLLLEKNNYVEIVLSQMEKKYSHVNYKQLQEIRINSSCRYFQNQKNKHYYSMHVLDEVMENVNMWVKGLPLGDNEESWVLHSPNVTLARKCLQFDKVEYRRGLINFDKYIEDGVFEEREYTKSLYVSPRKSVEKKRIFEFLVKYVNKETPNRQSSPKEMISVLDTLETKLDEKYHKQDNTSHSNNDDDDLNEVIDNINSLTEISQNNNVNDDQTSIHSELSDDNNESDDEYDNQQSSHIGVPSCHHKYATCDLYMSGKEEMNKRNFIVTRIRKKQRFDRNRMFINDLFQKIDNERNSESSYLQWLRHQSQSDESPSFSSKFRLMRQLNKL